MEHVSLCSSDEYWERIVQQLHDTVAQQANRIQELERLVSFKDKEINTLRTDLLNALNASEKVKHGSCVACAKEKMQLRRMIQLQEEIELAQQEEIDYLQSVATGQQAYLNRSITEHTMHKPPVTPHQRSKTTPSKRRTCRSLSPTRSNKVKSSLPCKKKIESTRVFGSYKNRLRHEAYKILSELGAL